MKNLTSLKIALLTLTMMNLGISAPPIEKTGACPTLTRSTANPSDNWGQYPVKPGGGITSGTIQNPLTPAQSINCITVPTGLKVQQVASEAITPGLNSKLPLAYIMEFTFDERGRVWAVEPRDYPYVHDTTGMPDATVSGITTTNGIAADRIHGGKGRILILTDNDGDGSLDSYKVFYDGLALPTSVELVKGGVIAIVPPNIYFIAASQTNPDTAGAAPVVIVSNMGSSSQNYDAHGQTNSLTWGIDNFMYGNVGYNGCGTPQVTGGNSATGCTTGSIWRFKSTNIGSDTNLVQVYGLGNSGTNAHGIGQTEDGQWFASKATVTNMSHHVVRFGSNVTNILTTNYNQTDSVHNFYPSTTDYYLWEGSSSRTFTFNGKTVNGSNETAVSGHDFYTATLLPSIYRTYSFVCEGATHLCNQNYMTINGSTWRANRIYGGSDVSNIFSGTDAWVAPFKVRTGPDGALWVLDWYNYLFLHNPATPATDAAWRNALRYKTRSRIYRIVPSDGSTQPVLNLSNASISDLVNTLGHSNMLWRTTAQRLLLNRTYTTQERTDLLTQLQSILETNRTVDTAFGTSPQVLHAMWVVAGMKQYTFNAEPTRWDTTFKKLLLHPAWTVRRNALLAMPPTVATSNSIVSQCAVNDNHPHVRIQALAALIANPAPGTPATMVASYHNTDSYSTAAFTSAGTSKVTEIAGTSRPSTCPSYLPAVSIRSEAMDTRAYPRTDLHFRTYQNGFDLLPYGQLASGELTVYDLRGTPVFHSTYNAGKSEWSQKTAKGLNMSVYFYSFRGINGDKFDGKIFLTKNF